MKAKALRQHSPTLALIGSLIYVEHLIVVVLALVASTTMSAATRYYLPNTGAADVSPTFDTWNVTASADRIKMVGAPISSTLTDKSVSYLNGQAALGRQYVSAPIGVVNFNGTTFSAVIRCKGSGNLFLLATSVRLYHSNGTFSTLSSRNATDIDCTSTAQTRIQNASALANVTSTNGDRIVIEIGVQDDFATDDIGILRFGDNAGSDFALTSGLTTDLNPWAEFSATIPVASRGNFFELFGWLKIFAR